MILQSEIMYHVWPCVKIYAYLWFICWKLNIYSEYASDMNSACSGYFKVVVISLFIRVKHESFIALLIIFTCNCLARRRFNCQFKDDKYSLPYNALIAFKRHLLISMIFELGSIIWCGQFSNLVWYGVESNFHFVHW